ncbi:NADP-dependent oxidoreductase [Actinomadura madurae]|uniref:NADP-dependent oxidoreductase n=1 Tax=Actinomadura madurae TaxID=1993 RepID=UPI0020D24744|nr:NADP-dependent oxidoreductase [Actinomadura madurae]MCP9950367.1 NADP-dependent oxidoreductase [Actinomadura madurae]MCQ0015825.1 NADP-dependent oxidoreductase [Actinomadura madurae]
MRAVTYDSFASDNSRLKVGDVPDPKVGPGQVLIEVRAAGVNPVDWKVMAGGLDGMLDTVFPVIPGWDVAGVVRALGPDVPEFAPGDEVMSYARKDVVGAGTFAQYVAVAADHVAHKPASLDWNRAGGLPLAGMTAQRALDRLGVGPGEILLVHAASGGVGSFAVQIGRDRGARVIGTASEKNHDYLRELGAEPVAYGDGLAERVRELAPGGVSAVADFVGGPAGGDPRGPGGGRAARLGRRRHRRGARRSLDLGPSERREARPARGAGRPGRPRRRGGGTFPLEGTAAAFDASRSGHTRGKLVVTP